MKFASRVCLESNQVGGSFAAVAPAYPEKQREQRKTRCKTLMKNLHLPVFVAGGIHCQAGNLGTFPVFCPSGILYRASTVAGGVFA